jgi:TonB family protein
MKLLAALGLLAGLGACGLQFNHDRSSSRVAEYVEEWDFRVHRLALFHLPADRERNGIVRTRIVVRPDGAIESLNHVSSGDAALDEAVLRIIKLATPFPPFPGAMREAHSSLVLERIWVFSGRTVEFYASMRERDACRTGAEASCLRFPLAPAAP